MTITYEWRGDIDNSALNELHAEGFGGPVGQTDWRARLHRHSLGWVCAREDDRLVGFVNVAWDGGDHAFLLDTKTRGTHQRRGIGTRLVAVAAEQARAAGCEWLHVDYRDGLGPFYVEACGFRPTAAGLVHLNESS